MPRRVALAAAAELTRESFGRRGSGRIRHEEKITVYVSAEELLALEQARLTLRARHGMAVDRGRIVREAIALMLADLEASGDDSELVRRLSAS
jgi:phage tail protein X